MLKHVLKLLFLVVCMAMETAAGDRNEPIFVGYGRDPKWSPGETCIALLRNDTLFVTQLDAKRFPVPLYTGPILRYEWLDDSTLVTQERTIRSIPGGKAQVARIVRIPLHGVVEQLARDSIKIGFENDRGLQLTKFADGSVGYFDNALPDQGMMPLSRAGSKGIPPEQQKPTLYVKTKSDRSSWGKVWLYYGSEDNGRQLTQSENDYQMPRLAPSQDKLFCWAQRGDLVIFDTLGNELANLGRMDMASWDAQGKYITFCDAKYSEFDIEKADIFIAKYDGSEKRQLTRTPDIVEFEPAFSPSSRYVMYSDERTGAIYVVKVR